MSDTIKRVKEDIHNYFLRIEEEYNRNRTVKKFEIKYNTTKDIHDLLMSYDNLVAINNYMDILLLNSRNKQTEYDELYSAFLNETDESKKADALIKLNECVAELNIYNEMYNLLYDFFIQTVDQGDYYSKREWEEEKLFEELRKLISGQISNYTMDEKLDLLIKSIPETIQRFKDCNSEEEFRMLAKKSDGTLATIQSTDARTGFKFYDSISLDSYGYKKFYFETLAFCLIYFVLFFKDIRFQIKSNDSVRTGIFTIDEKSLPHLLGIEPKIVSSKDSTIMESIIPGYNSLGILDKIMSIIINNEKIIEYEKEHHLDIFNYYKNMQKNKEFLLMGRFFNADEKGLEQKNKVVLATHSSNQLCLYKTSNMNSDMQRNTCKMILQQLDTGDYFPRSLQSIPTNVFAQINAINLLPSQTQITIDGEAIQVNNNKDGLDFTVLNTGDMLGIYYGYGDVNAAPVPVLEGPVIPFEPNTRIKSKDYYELKEFIDFFGLDESLFEDYLYDDIIIKPRGLIRSIFKRKKD